MKIICIGLLLSVSAGLARSEEPKLRLDLGSGTNIELIQIPAGEFTQGSPANEPGRSADETQRTVRLSADFYLSRTAITRGQWERFVAETHYRTEAEVGTSGGYGWDGHALAQRKEFTWKMPGFSQDNTHPVCLITYDDALAFCKWLEKRIHRKTTLPTEAQWEYACRAGTATPWHSGNETDSWHKENSGNSTHPADSNVPNTWDLVIGGNVSEWCLDWYAPYEATAQTDPLQGNPNLSDKPRRVLRGGSWNRDVKNTRSAARFRSDPKSRNADIGFRIVCASVENPLQSASPPVPKEISPMAEDPSSQTASHSNEPSSIPMDFSDRQNQSPAPLRKILFLLVPIGAIILMIRAVFRNRTRVSLYDPTPSSEPSLRSSTVIPSRNLNPAVRLTDNGFWIKSNWPIGSTIFLSYAVNGIQEQHSVIYQPASDGQFIFTGQRPDSVSISETGQIPQAAPQQILPVQPMFQQDDDNFRGGFRPSHRPSAY